MRPRVGRLAALVVVLALAPGTGRASLRPQLTADLGGTFLVSAAEPNGGGYSVGFAATWPVESPLGAVAGLRFGVIGFADDMGSELARLKDPNDPSIDLGPAESAHRMTWGGAWRLDASAGGSRWGWTPVGHATWGAWRVQDDVRGALRRALTSTGFGLGLGLERPVSARHALGVGVQYKRLFNDVVGRYVSAGLSWRWKLGD